MRPPHVRPAAAAAALLALSGCAGMFEPPWAERLAASAAPPPVGAARAFDLPPPGSPAAARAATAFPAPGQVYISPPPTPAQRDQAEIVARCRAQAEQTILQRDRGQLLREDERDARIGSSASLYDARAPLDRLGRTFAAGRMAEDCVDANRPPTPRR